ncbi:MAG: hypothetical protein IPG91_01615 [Ideonella sp.]|nr:hypothetical protein [Ideonella sp.]
MAGRDLGYHLIKTEEAVFDLLGGLACQYTKCVTDTVTAAELLHGEELRQVSVVGSACRNSTARQPTARAHDRH